MELCLFNTLTGQVEPLVTGTPREARMYVCGLTVYSRGHVGNFRTLVATDLLRRTLRYKGYRVQEVMNITDVDDRIIELCVAAGQDIQAFTAPHIRAFEEDMATLNMERPEHMPRATDHMPEMIDVISRLVARGHTYVADGSVYFRIATFPEYGRLARLDVEGLKAGARVDSDKYDKENARDFVLWKAKRDEPAFAQWDAPFGRGRPGWHIECSAMGMKYLGETFDIHCGGVDLIFPHHENEIAQSTCATGRPFVRHWVHVEHLLLSDETMSKSKGNVFNIPEVVGRGHRPEAIRYLYCQSHYRKTINFTWDALKQAAAALERVRGFAQRLGEIERDGPTGEHVVAADERAAKAFDQALCDDLNTSEALAAVHSLVSEGNSLMADGAITRSGAELLRRRLEQMDAVFGCLLAADADTLTSEEQGLLDERQEARRRRDFARADTARQKLEDRGVILEDTAKGTRWRRKS